MRAAATATTRQSRAIARAAASIGGPSRTRWYEGVPRCARLGSSAAAASSSGRVPGSSGGGVRRFHVAKSGIARCFESGGARSFGSGGASEQHGNGGEEEEATMTEVREANERCQGHIHLKRVNPHQWGVFASRPYHKGSTVIASTPLSSNTNGRPNPSPTSCSHSIQIGWNEHLSMELPARFLNHSCDPNVGVGGLNESGSYDFVALRDIVADEEIRFDYETTEYEVGAFSECHCGSSNCRGSVRGYKHSADVIRGKYGEQHIAGYLVVD